MSGRRLYIGRLSQDATRKDVEDYFGGSHGPIVDIRIMAGFCFLEYEELKVRPVHRAPSSFDASRGRGEHARVADFFARVAAAHPPARARHR